MNVTYRVRSKFSYEDTWIEEYWNIKTLEEAMGLLKDSKKIYPELEYSIIKVEEI